MSGRRRWVASVLIAVVTLTVLIIVFHRPLLKQVAAALVVEDRLEHSDAIVVVAGMEGALPVSWEAWWMCL